jgi:hypothetical protein
MSDSKIENISSLKKMRETANGFRALKTIFPYARPLLGLFRVDTKALSDTLAQYDQLDKETRELISMPDRFNNLFTPHGWIIFDSLDMTVVKAAVQKGEAGDLEGAEADLVAYYTPENVEFLLRGMRGIKAFRDRMRLASLAAQDYAEERYHACIPVVLALMDGLVNEVNEANRGMFAEGTELKAWDSVSAHARGWGELIKLLSKGRRKTYTEEITVPYRNGILHGMDLRYDNKVVAAKTWAALFATREWALKAEKGQLQEPPEEPKRTWSDTFKQLTELETTKKLLEAWTPREIRVGVDLPATGQPEDFNAESPERRLVEFLNFWQKGNYGYMARCLPSHGVTPAATTPQRVREHFLGRELTGYMLTAVEDKGAGLCVIDVELSYTEESALTPKEFSFRMIFQSAEGDAMARGQQGGSWVVYNAFYL